jgi:ATP-dependent DNA helicase RecQ
VAPLLREADAPALRALYVGLTRAKRNLYIHTVSSTQPFCDMAAPIRHHVEPSTRIPITIALTHRDVYLDYFKNNKSVVMKLRSGDPLRYSNGFLYSMQNEGVAVLSQSRKEEMTKLEAKGYQVTSAEVSFVVAWSPMDDDNEYAVCLANLNLSPASPR